MFVGCCVVFVAIGCSNDDASDDNSTPAASATARRTSTPFAATSTDAEATDTAAATLEPAQTQPPAGAGGNAPLPPSGTTVPSGGTQPPPPPPPAGQRTYSLAEAQAITQSAVLMPGDIGPGWGVMSDTTTDNASAAAADPRGGASFDRCGRLTGRVLTLQPAQDQLVSRYIGGESVSFFTLLNVYATADGATDCSIESAQRFSEPGELARQFSNIFVDVNAVVVTPVSYPQVAEGSIAFTLAGQINAAGSVVDLTILIVAFRKGNVSAVVGSAAAAAPSTAELAPHVDTVIARISAAQ
jgi:hypothetical protein